MDAPRLAVRASALAAVGLLLAIVLAVVLTVVPQPASALVQRDGEAFVLPSTEGAYEAAWGPERLPVLVVVTRQAVLDGVEEARGEGQATQAIPLPGGLAVFAVSGRSNLRGCTGALVTTLGASADIGDYDGDGLLDGRFMDHCHHGQWDVFHKGAEVPGTPTCGRLAMLRLERQGDALVSTGFDGPEGPRGSDC